MTEAYRDRPVKGRRRWEAPRGLPAPSRIRGYKWLAEGSIDPDGAFAWVKRDGAPSPWMRIGGPVPTALRASHAGGLPYEVNDELWEVELDAPAGHQPFLDQLPYNRLRVFDDYERSVLAMRGRLLRRVGSWAGDVAEDFSRWCATAARNRLLQALREAGGVLASVQDLTDLLRSPISRGAGEHPVFARREHPSRELIGLERAHELIGIWSAARTTAAAGPAGTARAFAAAAARMRAVAASTYATLLRNHEALDGLQSVAACAYASERRRQAMWLHGRLGLCRTEARGPSVAAAGRSLGHE